MMKGWRENEKHSEIILMADMNEYIGDCEEFYDFCQDTTLIDSISLLNSDMEKEPTYLYGSNRIDYIYITPTLAECVIKAGH